MCLGFFCARIVCTMSRVRIKSFRKLLSHSKPIVIINDIYFGIWRKKYFSCVTLHLEANFSGGGGMGVSTMSSAKFNVVQPHRRRMKLHFVQPWLRIPSLTCASCLAIEKNVYLNRNVEIPTNWSSPFKNPWQSRLNLILFSSLRDATKSSFTQLNFLPNKIDSFKNLFRKRSKYAYVMQVYVSLLIKMASSEKKRNWFFVQKYEEPGEDKW